MSYIGRCQLSGYKSIKDVSCEFNKGLNVIIGKNGSGKTNLLEFIYKILKRDYSGLDVFNATIQIVNKQLSFEWATSGVVSKKRVNQIDIPQQIIKDPEPDKNLFVEFIRFNLPVEIPVLATEYNPKYNFNEKRLLLNGSNSDLPYVVAYWLPVYFSSPPFTAIKNSEDLTSDFIFEVLTERFDNTLVDIKQILSLYTPIENVRLSNAIRVTRIDSSTFEIRNICFEYKVNNQWFEWNALSDGTKRLVYAIFKIYGVIIRGSQIARDKDLEALPIVFIEEPELGIHPHQLHSLMTLLKERAEKQQIILTTHSPQVLDVLGTDELDRIFISEIDYDKGTTVRKLTEKETDKAKYYLQNEGMLSDYWRFSDLQRSKESM